MNSAAGSARPGGAAAEARLRARRRAEARFRAYGLVAIVVAGAALAVLVASIAIQSVSAFTAYHVVLDVPVEDEAGGDPARVDYSRRLREALFAALPEVEGRAALRDLSRLVHSLNAPDLRRKAMARPADATGPVRFAAPLDDDLDLFLKGRVYRSRLWAGAGEAAPSARTGVIAVATTQNGFASLRERVKARLARQAAALDLQVARATADLERLRAGGEDAASAAVAAAQTTLSTATARRDAARERVQTLAPLALEADGPSVLILINGGVVKVERLGAAAVAGRVLVPLQSLEPAGPDAWRVVEILTPEADRARNKFSDAQAAYALTLRDRGVVKRHINRSLFTAAASNEPELAGLLGALAGSVLTILVTVVLALPLGVAAAVYLEEFAPKNRLTDAIEVNINNLAAVPSIVFGLLGAAVFLNLFGRDLGLSSIFGRGFPLVGGLVLALMTLPTVIIATRAALRAVPPSVREGALSVGASPLQTAFDHVMPLAAPGIFTGAIIGLAQALGETAPLLLIGMAAFVADVPDGVTSTATVLPVQIYEWANRSERAFEPLAAGAIMVLLAVMTALNLTAVFLRWRFERRW